MKKRVAILVSKYRYEEHYIDDVVLKEELENRGFKADIINWDSATYDFSLSDLAIIRSCWDYDERVNEFIERIGEISKVTKLINPYTTVVENSNKLYLKKIEEKGIPVVKTEFLCGVDGVCQSLAKIGSEKVIVKPSVSASGKNTHRFHIGDPDIHNTVEELSNHSEVIIQPYISSIEDVGEKSTVVINGEIVYTMKKTPAEGGFLVHTHKGGTYTPSEVEEKDMPFLNKVIENLPEKTAYVRIDYLFDENKQAILLELEMIEPNLYLNINKKGLHNLCDYIESALS